jgi:hypothetical protein
MTNELIRNIVFARAMVVEPFAVAICPDPLNYDRRPFARSGDRWRRVASRPAYAGSGAETPEPEDPSGAGGRW